MMEYTRDFDLFSFPWSNKAKAIIERIIIKGGEERLVEALRNAVFCGSAPSEREVNRYVEQNEEYLNEECCPPKGMKKFEVFFRIEGVIKEEVTAKNSKDAAKKAYLEIMDGDPLLCIDRSDVDYVKPVAYNDENGDTKDYPKNFDVED